jgi:hypothetical protein
MEDADYCGFAPCQQTKAWLSRHESAEKSALSTLVMSQSAFYSRVMRWPKINIRRVLLGHPESGADSELDSQTDDIRESMLALLEPCGAVRHANLIRRIRYADDPQSLWYLRGDLMAALAASQGERAAREEVLSITAQFEGLVPRALNSRPSPLA